MKKLAAAIFCLSTLGFAAEYDPVRGEMLSLSCASCHGTDGKSVAITVPIGGMGAETLYQTLLAYKKGLATGTMMPQHTKGFTEEELFQVSQYFSRVKR